MGILGDNRLAAVQPTDRYKSNNEEASTDAEQRRWLYGMLVDAAIELVEGKYGAVSGPDRYYSNVDLGVSTEAIYGLLGLNLD